MFGRAFYWRGKHNELPGQTTGCGAPARPRERSGPRWGRGAHRRVVTSPAPRGGEASASSLGARARLSRGCGAGTGRAPEAWANPRPRPHSALRFLPAIPPAAASAAGPGLWWEGRCHSPSPRRPGSCVAGAGVSSARPAAASDPARPPSPQRLTRAFPARGPAPGFEGRRLRPRSLPYLRRGPGVGRVCGV